MANYVQKTDPRRPGFYLRIDPKTGEEKEKVTPGPYKKYPILDLEMKESRLEEKIEERAEERVEERVEEKVEEKPQKGAGTGKRYTVTVDDSIAKIVSLDQEGYNLSFESEPGKFVELPDEVLKKLERINRMSYLVSAGLNSRAQREKDHPEDFSSGVRIEAARISARKRMAVEGKKPGWWYAWRKPAELGWVEREGGKVARHEGLRTFMGSGNEVHRVGDSTTDELILTMKPKEVHDAEQKEISDKSVRRKRGVERQSLSELKGRGFLPGDREDGRNWTPPSTK